MNNAVSHFKSEGIDLSSILHKPKSDKNFAVRNVIKQDHKLENVIDFDIISRAGKALVDLKSIKLV